MQVIALGPDRLLDAAPSPASGLLLIATDGGEFKVLAEQDMSRSLECSAETMESCVSVKGRLPPAYPF